MQKLFLALVLILLQTPVSACLWDRDTLANEAREFPDAVRVITGRFERNPPLYYEMRLNRVAAEVIAHPERLSLYDDAGVAADHLGRDDQAIRWMELKRYRLDAATASNPDVKEHRYRYYANLGTFHAHHWIRGGADRKHMGEVKQARDLIAKALQINPNAHFGREKYQLLTLEWIIDPRVASLDYSDKTDRYEKKKRPVTLFRYLREKKALGKDAVQGISGLIVLGNAWESVDMFNTLAWILSLRRKANIGYLAHLRVEELHRKGKVSFADTLLKEEEKQNLYDDFHGMLIAGGEVERQYPLLRREAEEWNRQRQAYMLARLGQGRHPDTDSTFWAEYHESAPPSLKLSGVRQSLMDPLKWVGYLFFACLALLFFLVAGKLYRWMRPDGSLRTETTRDEESESVSH